MSLAICGSAISNGIRFTIGGGEVAWVPGSPTITRLDDADQQILADWLARVGVRGIDAAMDLSVRPWRVSGAGAIIGVFGAGQAKASWLIVGHSSGWTLARCSDGFVSDVVVSLPAALALIDADQAP